MPETTCRAAAEADELRAALAMAKGEIARLEAERDAYRVALVAIRDETRHRLACGEIYCKFASHLRGIIAKALAVRAAAGPDGGGA